MPRFAITQNARAAHRATYAFTDVLSIGAAHRARNEMARCPLYAATPLLNLEGIAHMAGVARVFYKDEATRFGTGSFKALGGAYAVALLLARKVSQQLKRDVAVAELVRRAHADLTGEVTVVCASDGNHGRSVAAGAQVFGCKCVIFLHEGVSAGRENAITALGAKVVRTPGNYDDSVCAAADAAQAHGWELVSDTSWPGYHEIPATVMQGYTVMVLEVLEQLRASDEALPTHVFLQGGVGGLAAAVVAHLWEELGPERAPIFIVVEPERADCLFQSALFGERRLARGDLNTLMAGLACGETSEVAWKILEAGAEFFVTIPDEAAVSAMRLLASLAHPSSPIVAGESATAGLAALLALTDQSRARDPRQADPRLNADSRVLLFGTEGATDLELYRQLVGGDAEAFIRQAVIS